MLYLLYKMHEIKSLVCPFTTFNELILYATYAIWYALLVSLAAI